MPVTELLASTRPASVQSQDSVSRLPADTPVSAQVRSVKADPQQPGQFRVEVQLQGSQAKLELMTRQPPPQGSQIQLFKTDSGKLQLLMPQLPPSNSQGKPQPQPATGVSVPVTSNTPQVQQLIQLIQPGQSITATVLQSPANTGQPSNAPASSAANPAQALATPNGTPAAKPTSGSSQASTQGLQVQLQLAPQPGQSAPANRAMQMQVQLAVPAGIQVTPNTQVQIEHTAQNSLNVRIPVNNTAQGNTAPPAPPGNNAPSNSLLANLPQQSPDVQARINQLLPLRTSVPGQIVQPPTQPAVTTPATQTVINTNGTASLNTAPPAGPAQSLPASAATLDGRVQTASVQPPKAQAAPSSPAGQLAQSAQAINTSNRPLPAINYPVTVQLAQAPVQLSSPQPLQPGLNVEVTRQSDLQVELRPQPAQPKEMPLSSPQASKAAQAALREALPGQIPLAAGLNQLNQLNQQHGQAGALDKAVRALFQALSIQPSSPNASQQVQNAVQNSGQFTELHLARGNSPLPDVKQVLGQLLQQSEQLPAQAREQMQQLVQQLQARATSQQLTSLQQWRELPDGSMERNFRFDLPVHNGQRYENVDMQLRERQSSPDRYSEPQSHWRLRLHFDLRPAGSLDVELTLENDIELGATFWSESPVLISQLQNAQQTFARQLNQDGFQVQALHIRQGSLKEPQRPALERRLVDIRT